MWWCEQMTWHDEDLDQVCRCSLVLVELEVSCLLNASPAPSASPCWLGGGAPVTGVTPLSTTSAGAGASVAVPVTVGSAAGAAVAAAAAAAAAVEWGSLASRSRSFAAPLLATSAIGTTAAAATATASGEAGRQLPGAGRVTVADMIKSCSAELVMQMLSIEAGRASSGSVRSVLRGGLSLLRSYGPQAGASSCLPDASRSYMHTAFGRQPAGAAPMAGAHGSNDSGVNESKDALIFDAVNHPDVEPLVMLNARWQANAREPHAMVGDSCMGSEADVSLHLGSVMLAQHAEGVNALTTLLLALAAMSAHHPFPMPASTTPPPHAQGKTQSAQTAAGAQGARNMQRPQDSAVVAVAAGEAGEVVRRALRQVAPDKLCVSLKTGLLRLSLSSCISPQVSLHIAVVCVSVQHMCYLQPACLHIAPCLPSCSRYHSVQVVYIMAVGD